MNYLLNWFIFILTVFSFTSCVKERIDVRTACEERDSDEYILKWETFPPIEGHLKIRELKNGDESSEGFPIKEVPISSGYTTVPKKRSSHVFYELIFNDKKKSITANRSIETENIIGLRDIGGYQAQNGKQLKWGMIYRSGNLSKIKKEDIQVLNELGIKTIVDLRTNEEALDSPPVFNAEQYFRVPLAIENPKALMKDVLSGKLTREEVLEAQKKMNYYMVENSTEQFKHYFEILSNPKNYPILVFCSIGKDRAGLAIAITLAALDVDEEQIHRDYVYSNNFISDYKKIFHTDTLSTSTQEAVTAFFTAQPLIIKSARNFLSEKYGSVDEYLMNTLKLTKRQQDDLKKIMYYEHE